MQGPRYSHTAAVRQNRLLRARKPSDSCNNPGCTPSRISVLNPRSEFVMTASPPPAPESNTVEKGGGAVSNKKSFWRAFLDFFVLFSGVSTASNLSRTRNTPVKGRGLFLFRSSKKSARSK